MNSKWKKAFSLFLYFFRIGWFTFGGGWSMVAQIQKDFVEKREEISKEDLLDIVSVGRSLPGTMIGNVAYMFGYRCAGIPGALLSLLGMTLPSLIILVGITYCYSAFRDNIYVAKALVGVRASVVPIIGSAALKLRKGAFPRWECYVLFAAALFLSAGFGVSCILLVIMGAIAGLILGGKKNADAV